MEGGTSMVLSKSSSSSVGGSSRIYYRPSSQGVPFTWEMQPGTPKVARKEDVLPPLSPPPAILSKAYPRPNINVDDDDQESPSSRFYTFYKLKSLKRSLKLNLDHYHGIKEKIKTRLIIIAGGKNNVVVRTTAGDRHEVCSSSRRSNLDVDVDLTASPRRSSFSSSSTTTSSTSSNSVNSTSGRRWSPTSPATARNKSLTRSSNYSSFNGCNPWNISSVIVRVATRR